MLLPVQSQARVVLIHLVFDEALGLILPMKVVYLLTICGPLINVLDRVAFLHLLLNCWVVAAALLLMPGTLLIDLGDVLGALVAQRVSFYRVLRPRVLARRRIVCLYVTLH